MFVVSFAFRPHALSFVGEVCGRIGIDMHRKRKHLVMKRWVGSIEQKKMEKHILSSKHLVVKVVGDWGLRGLGSGRHRGCSAGGMSPLHLSADLSLSKWYRYSSGEVNAVMLWAPRRSETSETTCENGSSKVKFGRQRRGPRAGAH